MTKPSSTPFGSYFLPDTITAALSSPEFIKRCIAEEGLNLTCLLLHKNADYGNSALFPPVLAPHVPPEQAILVRMSDKVARLTNLLSKGAEISINESIADTISDLAGYAILYRVAQKTKPVAISVEVPLEEHQPQRQHDTPSPRPITSTSDVLLEGLALIQTKELSKNDIFR